MMQNDVCNHTVWISVDGTQGAGPWGAGRLQGMHTEDGADGDAGVDVGRAVEGVEDHHIVPREGVFYCDR